LSVWPTNPIWTWISCSCFRLFSFHRTTHVDFSSSITCWSVGSLESWILNSSNAYKIMNRIQSNLFELCPEKRFVIILNSKLLRLHLLNKKSMNPSTDSFLVNTILKKHFLLMRWRQQLSSYISYRPLPSIDKHLTFTKEEINKTDCSSFSFLESSSLKVV
jgi:hypothetical protein